MKISIDTMILSKTEMSFEEKYKLVADMGYEYVSLCDFKFPGMGSRPKAIDEDIIYHNKLLKDVGLKAASIVTGYAIADPDEYWRQAAVKWWQKMFDIGEKMGVRVFNSELNGDNTQPRKCEEQFMRSLDELLPILQKRGMRMEFQAHPNDFYERHDDAYSIIRSYNCPEHIGYLYAIPHSFRYDDGKGDVGKMIRDCQKHLTHVIFADTHNHLIPWRYNINPADSAARVHGHLGLGKGDIDWDACFQALRDIKFAERDTIACVTLFGFPELLRKEGIEFREHIERELALK